MSRTPLAATPAGLHHHLLLLLLRLLGGHIVTMTVMATSTSFAHLTLHTLTLLPTTIMLARHLRDAAVSLESSGASLPATLLHTAGVLRAAWLHARRHHYIVHAGHPLATSWHHSWLVALWHPLGGLPAAACSLARVGHHQLHMRHGSRHAHALHGHHVALHVRTDSISLRHLLHHHALWHLTLHLWRYHHVC